MGYLGHAAGGAGAGTWWRQVRQSTHQVRVETCLQHSLTARCISTRLASAAGQSSKGPSWHGGWLVESSLGSPGCSMPGLQQPTCPVGALSAPRAAHCAFSAQRTCCLGPLLLRSMGARMTVQTGMQPQGSSVLTLCRGGQSPGAAAEHSGRRSGLPDGHAAAGQAQGRAAPGTAARSCPGGSQPAGFAPPPSPPMVCLPTSKL